jgi:hypothetical protein
LFRLSLWVPHIENLSFVHFRRASFRTKERFSKENVSGGVVGPGRLQAKEA